MKKILSLVIKIVITLAAIFFIWWSVKDNVDDLALNLRLVNKAYLIGGFVIFLLTTWLIAVRMKLVFAMQELKLTLKQSFYLTLIGFFFNNFLPTSIGGDVVKAHYAAKHFQDKKVECYAAVFANRVVGLMSIIILALLASFFSTKQIVTPEIKLTILVLALLTVLFAIFSLNKNFARCFKSLAMIFKSAKLNKIVRQSYKVLNDFKENKKMAAVVLLSALLTQSLLIIACFILANGLNIQLSPVVFFLFVPIIFVIGMIPSIGGAGPKEGAFVLLFGALIGNAPAVALALLWLAYFWGASLLGGLIYVFSDYRYLRK